MKRTGIIIILCCLGLNLRAVDRFTASNLRFLVLSDSTVEVCRMSDSIWSDDDMHSSSRLVCMIPEQVSYEDHFYQVVAIGDGAFEGYQSLQTVMIPASVLHIGTHAFRGCSSLINLMMSDTVNDIDATALDATAWWDAQAIGLVYINRVLYGYKGDRTKVHSLMIREGTTAITRGALVGFTQLKQLSLPKHSNFDLQDLQEKVKLVYY